MTIEEWKEAGFSITDTSLYLDAGLEWLEEHTTIQLEEYTVETIKALPSKAKLFLLNFSEIMQRETGIVSESIAGMSQTFQEQGKDALIWNVAKTLLKGQLKSTITVLPARKRWN